MEKRLAHPQAHAEDFTDTLYAASKEPSRHDAAKALFQQAFALFSNEPDIFRIAGWSWLNFGDAVAADAAFRRTQELLAEEAHSDTDLLAGLAISSWLTDRREEAIGYYRALIATGREKNPSVDWTHPDSITTRGWPAAETQPLEAVRAATLKQYPELTPSESQ